MKTCVIYTRARTDVLNDSYDAIVDQKKECCKFAWKNSYAILNFFEDVNKSANDYAREGLQEMIRFCKKNKTDFVLATDADRIARDFRLYLQIETLLKRLGTKIIFVSLANDCVEEKFIDEILASLGYEDRKIRSEVK